MRTITLTQGKEALVFNEDFDWLNQWHWFAHLSNGGYYAVWNGSSMDGKRSYIYMHNLIAARMGLIGRIDHKDRNPLNNQRSNLRVATRSQNAANQGVRSNNSSGFKGAFWDKRAQRWKAEIRFENRTRHLGHFDSAIEAAQAYDRAAVRLFGQFAVLNFPKVD